MKIPSRAAARLARLTETFDDPEIDLTRSLSQFAGQVKSAVPSFLGVSVEMTAPDLLLTVDAMEAAFTTGSIRSSVRIPTSITLGGQPAQPERSDGAEITLVLYAAAPGALVDLAADLAWLTSLPLSAFGLDADLAGPRAGSSVEESAVVNQAIGVLLGRGRTPEQARADLDGRAAQTGLSAAAVAAALLIELTAAPPRPEPA